MADDNLSCIKCGKQMMNYMAPSGFQPSCGLAFSTHGHYGSTVFDPMDGSFLTIAVCDECVATADAAGHVRHSSAPTG